MNIKNIALAISSLFMINSIYADDGSASASFSVTATVTPHYFITCNPSQGNNLYFCNPPPFVIDALPINYINAPQNWYIIATLINNNNTDMSYSISDTNNSSNGNFELKDTTSTTNTTLIPLQVSYKPCSTSTYTPYTGTAPAITADESSPTSCSDYNDSNAGFFNATPLTGTDYGAFEFSVGGSGTTLPNAGTYGDILTLTVCGADRLGCT